MARVDWTGHRDIAEALIKSIQPDDPDSFRYEITEIDNGVTLSIFVSSRTRPDTSDHGRYSGLFVRC